MPGKRWPEAGREHGIEKPPGSTCSFFSQDSTDLRIVPQHLTGRERFPLWEETMPGRSLSVCTVSRPESGRNSCSENGTVCSDY